MLISDWSSDVCSSDLVDAGVRLLRLHALVIEPGMVEVDLGGAAGHVEPVFGADAPVLLVDGREARDVGGDRFAIVVLLLEGRSEEHTSELKSLMRISYAVFCLKKKNNTNKSKSHRKPPLKHYNK